MCACDMLLSVGQRLAVAVSCAVFWLMIVGSSVLRRKEDTGSTIVSGLLMAVLTLLACVEKLCSVMNMVSVERDWVGTSTIRAHSAMC